MKIPILILLLLGTIIFSTNDILFNEVYAGVRPPSISSPPDKGTIPNNSGVYEGTSFIDAVELIINWLLGFIGIIVFVIFLFAGFEYATAGDNPDKVKSAQSRMVNAIIGLLILFFAFVVSNAVLSFIFGGDAPAEAEASINNIINRE
jgi:hypothetical protein